MEFQATLKLKPDLAAARQQLADAGVALHPEAAKSGVVPSRARICSEVAPLERRWHWFVLPFWIPPSDFWLVSIFSYSGFEFQFLVPFVYFVWFAVKNVPAFSVRLLCLFAAKNSGFCLLPSGFAFFVSVFPLCFFVAKHSVRVSWLIKPSPFAPVFISFHPWLNNPCLGWVGLLISKRRTILFFAYPV